MKNGAADLSSFEPLPACKEIHVFCNISKIPDSFFSKNNGDSATIIDFHGYQYTDSDFYGLPYSFTIRNLDGTNFTALATNLENSTNLNNVSKMGMDQSFTNCQILSMTHFNRSGTLERLALDNCVATFGNTKCCPAYTLHITNMKLKSSDVYFEMEVGTDVLFENCELTMDSLSSNASNNAFLNAPICSNTIFRNCRIKYSSDFNLVYASSGAKVVIDNCIITNTGSSRPVLLKTPYTPGRVSQLEVTNSYLQKAHLVIGDYGDEPNYKVTWSQLVDCGGFSSDDSKVQFCDFSTPFTMR